MQLGSVFFMLDLRIRKFLTTRWAHIEMYHSYGNHSHEDSNST